MSQERIMEKIRELARELSPDNLDLAIADLQMIQDAAQQSVHADEGDSADEEEFTNPYLLSGEELERTIALRR